jgi:hypothetical protein
VKKLFIKNRIQVIVPGFKVFPHSMREAWALNLKQMGVGFDWIVHREGQAERTAKKIRPESLVLLLNDHHLDDLTGYLCDQGKCGRGRDGGIWVGLATERVVDSIFPRSEEKTRLCAHLCHLVAHFDPAASGVISAQGAIPYFCHQYADVETFRSRRSYREKKEGIFWSGKLKVGDFAGAYRDRVALFERIKDFPGFSWREATFSEKGIRHIVEEKDSNQGLLNLPSNCPGFTSNFFENLAMGACVLQHEVSGPHPEGMEPGVHYLAYCKNEPESLREVCERFMAEPGRFQKMAELGREACLRRHSLWIRAGEIFGAPSWENILRRDISQAAKDQLLGLVKKINQSQ